LNVIIILIVVVVGLIGVVFGVVMYKKKGAGEDTTRSAGWFYEPTVSLMVSCAHRPVFSLTVWSPPRTRFSSCSSCPEPGRPRYYYCSRPLTPRLNCAVSIHRYGDGGSAPASKENPIFYDEAGHGGEESGYMDVNPDADENDF
jgi:hypothetical protein